MSVNHNKLAHAIRTEMDRYGGWLSFEQWMSMALYEPELGYYETSRVFGEQGDFVTAVDMGPWLGLGFADLVCWSWRQLGQPESWVLLEQGGGSGRLMQQVTQVLSKDGVTMPLLVSVEASGHMRQRQQLLFEQEKLRVLQFETLAQWQQSQSEYGISHRTPCVMLSNELPDAFPVKCLIKQGDDIYERGVAVKQDSWVWKQAEQSLEDQKLQHIDSAIVEQWPQGYISEWNPHLQQWQQDVAGVADKLVVLTVDYGYTQQEYYRPNRVEGTLMGHLQHQAIHDVLSVSMDDLGKMDLTAHVDFTHLAKSGLDVGLQPVVFTTQGAWLAQSPSVAMLVQQYAEKPDVQSMRDVSFAKQLMMPFGMGETFKLLIQQKNMPDTQPPEFLGSFNYVSRLRL